MSQCVAVCGGLLGVLALSVLLPAYQPDVVAPERRQVRFAIGTPGGNLDPLSQAPGRAYEGSLPWLDVEFHERTASLSNVGAVLPEALYVRIH